MEPRSLQTIGTILVLAGVCASLAATFTKDWSHHIPRGDGGEMDTRSGFKNGLWSVCRWDGVKVKCKAFTTTSEREEFFQTVRGLVLVAMILVLLSLFMAGLAQECAHIGDYSARTKARLGLAAGSVSTLAGVCETVAASFYVYHVVGQSLHPLAHLNIRLSLGTAVYFAFFAGVVEVLGGLLLVAAFVKRKTTEKRYSQVLEM
uniref:claudin-19-like n=1 Tax=Myxine glutinosa TaxID=7769 RepID=UPI00358EF11F